MGHNPNLDARLVEYLKNRCKTQVDEEALSLISEIELPRIICEGGWHAEYLLRRLEPHQVEYLDSDEQWVKFEAGDSVPSLILGGWMKRFYGPLQTQKFAVGTRYEYIVYHMDIRSVR